MAQKRNPQAEISSTGWIALGAGVSDIWDEDATPADPTFSYRSQAVGENVVFGTFDRFEIPNSAKITGFQIFVRAWIEPTCSASSHAIGIDLSANGGTNYGELKEFTPTTTATFYTLGQSGDCWNNLGVGFGLVRQDWTPNALNDQSSFCVRLRSVRLTTPVCDVGHTFTWFVDYIWVFPYFTYDDLPFAELQRPIRGYR